jgi:3-methylfumaryl-CoA hydratase
VEHTELLMPEPAESLADLLGVAAPVDVLPPLWHWVYTLDRAPLRDLGPDGHPTRGGVPTPPGWNLRRRFAGGRARMLGELRLGLQATRSSAASRPVIKRGRSGRLAFVTVTTRIEQCGETAVVEEQDVVYLETAGRQEPTGGERAPGYDFEAVDLSAVTLFRFSALTYNAHRIHYDAEYARNVEGYAGLVVQGPLQALLMAERLRRDTGVSPRALEYRLRAPLILGQGLEIGRHNQEGADACALIADGGGRLVATMRAGEPESAEGWT